MKDEKLLIALAQQAAFFWCVPSKKKPGRKKQETIRNKKKRQIQKGNKQKSLIRSFWSTMRSVTKRDLITPSSDDGRVLASTAAHVTHTQQQCASIRRGNTIRKRRKRQTKNEGVTSETYWAWSHLGRPRKKCRGRVLRCCWPGTCRPPYRQS